MAVALLDGAATVGRPATPVLDVGDTPEPSGAATPFASVLALVALAILAGEWFLFRRGEIP